MSFPDGERVDCSGMLEAAGRMVSAVSLPTPGLYGSGLGEAAEAVAAIVEGVLAARAAAPRK